MSAANDVLAAIRGHGGDVKIIAPDRLKVLAPAAMLPDFVEQVRAVKLQLLAALSASAPNSQLTDEAEAKFPPDKFWWRNLYTARTFEWFLGDRDWEAAKRLAWGDLQNEWHDRHGKRWPHWHCAGCHAPIGGLVVLDLPDGNRVHFEPIECLIAFGKHWRVTADEALVAFGLEPPDVCKSTTGGERASGVRS
jgi:hypothetical protein